MPRVPDFAHMGLAPLLVKNWSVRRLDFVRMELATFLCRRGNARGMGPVSIHVEIVPSIRWNRIEPCTTALNGCKPYLVGGDGSFS